MNSTAVFPSAKLEMTSNLQQVWLTPAVVATLLNVDLRSVQRHCKSGRYTVRVMDGKVGRGGMSYEILLSSLPNAAQVRYWKDNASEQDVTTVTGQIDVDVQRYIKEPSYNRRKADKFLNAYKAAGGKKGIELQRFLDEWNRGVDEDMRITYRTYMRLQAEYLERGIDGIVSRYGKTKSRAISFEKLGEFGNEVFEYFKRLYLRENAPALQFCYRAVYGYAQQVWAMSHDGDVTEFDELFPCAETFERTLIKQIGESAIYRARHGEVAYNRKYANFVNRDYSLLRAGECWVSDHRQLDMVWINTQVANGKLSSASGFQLHRAMQQTKDSLLRPWITVWCDMKTQKWLSWSIHFEAPNSNHVIDTFVQAVQQYGVPSEIYIDNGKDYRAVDFAGGRRTFKIDVDVRKTRSLLAILGVNVHFAAPYNAQAKIIERTFGVMSAWMDKNACGYIGNNPVNRPAERYESDVRNVHLLTFEQGCEMVNFFVNELYHHAPCEGKNHRGLSRNELWVQEYKALPTVSDDALVLMRTRVSEVRTIMKNGLSEPNLNDYYYDFWMEAFKGRKVYMRRDADKYQVAWVFDAETDEYLGKARLGMWNAQALAKTDLQQQQVRDVIRHKKQTRKAIEQIAKQRAVNPIETLRNIAAGLNHTEESTAQTNIVQFTKFDDAMQTERRMAATGTYDVSALIPTETKKRIARDLFEK